PDRRSTPRRSRTIFPFPLRTPDPPDGVALSRRPPVHSHETACPGITAEAVVQSDPGRHQATIDGDVLAGDEARAIAGQELDHPSDVVGAAQLGPRLDGRDGRLDVPPA